MPVDLLTLDERLTRLENRIKTGFFEIEKKFASAPAAPEEGVHERLQEIEDLVLLIQLENTKIKEKLGTQEPMAESSGATERLAKLESVIEQLKSGGAAASDMEQRLAALEQKLSAQIPAQVKEGLDARLSKLEADAKKLSTQIPADITAKISNLESDIKDLRIESGKMTTKEVDENIAKINAARIELGNAITKFKSLKEGIDRSITEKQEVFSKLDKLELDVEKASAYFTRMKTTEEKINVIAGKIESLDEGVDAKMKSGFEKIELLKRDMENRFATTEEKFKARLEKLDATMESLDVKSQGIDEKISDLQAIGKDLADVAAIKTGVEEQALRTVSMEKRLDDLRVKFNSMKDVNAHIEEEAIIRQGLESRLQDVVSQLASMRSAKVEIEKAVGQGLLHIEEKIKSASVDEQLSAFDKKIADIEQGIEAIKEPLVHAKEEIDKAAQEKLNEFATDVENLKNVLHLEEIRNIRNEIAEHRKVIQNLKADLEVAAARFFTTNLEEFSRALDKKFPSFVSREDYVKYMNEVTQRLKTIEAPDLSPLATRVEMLERKLEDVHAMMKSLARTMPIVVE